MDFLVQLEQSGVGRWVRESNSLLSYPTILFLHTLGLGFLVGFNGAIDLRILGLARTIPLAPLERLFPLMWIAFAVNAVTGILVFISDASKHFANPPFFVKRAFVKAGI